MRVARHARLIAMAAAIGSSACLNATTPRAYAGPGVGQRHNVDGAVALQETARCVVRLAPQSAAKLLTLRPESMQEYDLASHFSGRYERCIPNAAGTLHFELVEFRGYIAEALYLKNYATDPDFSKVPHGLVQWPADWFTHRDVQKLLTIYMMHFGSCVAAADPQGAANLLRTEARSGEEKLAINRLRPSLGPCLANGKTFKLDAAILRALTAQGLYRNLSMGLTEPRVPQ